MYEEGERVKAYQSAYLDILPYQLAFGISLRWFEGRLAVRLYVGPFKWHI